MNIELYEKQWAALTTQANEVLYGGAVSGGKSFLLRYAALLYAFFIPGIEVYFFRRKYKDLLSNHLYGPNGFLSILDEFVKAGKVQINLSDLRIDFFHDNGVTSRIFLRHCQHESDMYNYQGAEFHVLLIDELTHFSSTIYKFFRTRVRLGSFKIDYKKVRKSLPFVYDGYFPRIICGSNPGNIGHQFVNTSWVKAAKPLQVWQAAPEDGGMRRVFIPALLTDNVKLLAEDPNYADRVRGMGGAMAEAYLTGNWEVADGGAMADVWRSDIHVVPGFNVPSNATVYRVHDWGTFHPSVVLYVMIATGEELERYDGTKWQPSAGSWIVIQEIYNWNGTENEGNRMDAYDVGMQMANMEFNQPWGTQVQRGPADGQIFNVRGGTNRTINDYIVEGYNDRVKEIKEAGGENGNKLHYNQSLFIRADQSANARVQGLTLVRQALKSAINGAKDKPGLYFTENAEHCIRTIPYLPRSEVNPEDVSQANCEDHTYDCVRYVILANKSAFQRLTVSGL